MRCCPNLGKSSPTTGNKRRFGPGAAQDNSQKRTDFTSLTDSLMTRSDRITQSTIRSSTQNSGIRRPGGPSAAAVMNKGNIFPKIKNSYLHKPSNMPCVTSRKSI